MQKRILVIDDDPDVLDVMQEALAYEGFAVVVRDNAGGCEELIREQEIDLLIIDYLLGGVNGGEVCRRIKSCPDLQNLPVIIFSAYPKVLQAPDSYCCDAFIPKPFDLADVVAQISGLLKCESKHMF